MKLRSIIVAVIALLIAGTASAQQDQLIPQDPAVRIGHLDNGLTYYIRHNALPEGKAAYYLVDKVGSMEEEDSQRGLAHFLEHLTSDGTEHFPGYTLDPFVERHGGYENAYTSFDRTAYYVVNMPTAKEEVIDSCLFIMKDWANAITLGDSAIDNERDVVHNEYRKSDASDRINERALPLLYPDCKYGQRLPIGLMSIIDSCSYDEIRSYFKKWYRPDNQAVIVVGDIDVDKIEAKIKQLFGGIVVPADAAKVVPVMVPGNKDAIYVIEKDKELEQAEIRVYMKHDAPKLESKKYVSYLVQNYIDWVISKVLGERYTEKAQETECPYQSSAVGEVPYVISQTENAFTTLIYPKPNKEVEAVSAALTEVKRVKDHGFTATEYSRAKDEYLSRLESSYTNRNKMKTSEFPEKYVEHFDGCEPIPSVEQKYKLMNEVIPTITLDMVNKRAQQLICFNDSNFVVFAELQEKEGATYPTAEQFAAAKAKVSTMKTEAYVDNAKQGPLVPKTPKAGKIVKITENKVLGFKQMTLSNGAKVVLKKTDYKDNEIKLYAYANGGYSAFPESRATEMKYLSAAAQTSGLGDFSSTELEKALAGKQVACGVGIGEKTRTLTGTSTPKDIETFMQLVYLNMTNISKDEKSFEQYRQDRIETLANRSKDPENIFTDSILNTLHCGDKYSIYATPEDVKALNYDAMLADIKMFFGNAKDFTFVFTGNFDEKTLMPLVKTYIASLPNSGKTFQNIDRPKYKGDVSCTYTQAMTTPNSHDYQEWCSNTTTKSLRNDILTSLVSEMLTTEYWDTIRVKLSATYTAGASCDMEYKANGEPVYYITTNVLLNPDKVELAMPYIVGAVNSLATKPSADYLKKAKESVINGFDNSIKTNEFWQNAIIYYLRRGIDTYTGYKETVSSITTKDIADFVSNILKSGNHAQILMKAVKE